MKILLTGGSGFIGTNFVNLLPKNYEISFISSKIKGKNSFNISLSNKNEVNDHFHDHQYDYVIHLGANLHDDNFYQLMHDNFESTFNLLTGCINSKIKNFIYVSSQTVYGKSNYLPIDESHPTVPITNYAISKLFSEEICKFFNLTYKIPIQILRVSSVYGYNQPNNFLLPKLFDSVKNLNKITVNEYLNGIQLMDFIHIDDVSNAIILSLKSKKKFGIYNICSGIPINVSMIGEEFLRFRNIKILKKKINFETNHVLLNNLKAKTELGFKPSKKLLISLEDLFNHYISNPIK